MCEWKSSHGFSQDSWQKEYLVLGEYLDYSQLTINNDYWKMIISHQVLFRRDTNWLNMCMRFGTKRWKEENKIWVKSRGYDLNKERRIWIKGVKWRIYYFIWIMFHVCDLSHTKSWFESQLILKKKIWFTWVKSNTMWFESRSTMIWITHFPNSNQGGITKL